MLGEQQENHAAESAGQRLPLPPRNPYADEISRRFCDAVDTLMRKRRERPGEPIEQLYREAPFRIDDEMQEFEKYRELYDQLREFQALQRGETLRDCGNANEAGLSGRHGGRLTVEEEMEARRKKLERELAAAAADLCDRLTDRGTDATSSSCLREWSEIVERTPWLRRQLRGRDAEHAEAEEDDESEMGEPCSMSQDDRTCVLCDERVACPQASACASSTSRAAHSKMSCTDEPMHPDLFCELLRQFYSRGWMDGSGGAMAAVSTDNRLLLSPSSLQKERVKACDLFVTRSGDLFGTPNRPTCSPKLKETACAGVFRLIMQRTRAQCVIHTHSVSANLLTNLIADNEFRISHQEYIKGIYDMQRQENMDNTDLLIVPIIENRPTENLLEPLVHDLFESFSYPGTTALLVRGHGAFIWGPTWQKAKIMTECYEYLFELAVKMLQHGVPLTRPGARDRTDPSADPSAPPEDELFFGAGGDMDHDDAAASAPSGP